MDDGDNENDTNVSAEEREKRKLERLKRHRERKQKRKSGDKLAAVTAKAIGELERPPQTESNVPHRSSAPPRTGRPPSIDPPKAPSIAPPTPPGGSPKKPAVGFSLPPPATPPPSLLSAEFLTEDRMNKLVVELSNDIYDMSRVDAIDCVSAMERFPTLLDLWIQTVKQQERSEAGDSGAHPDFLIDTETRFFEELADKVK